MFRRWSRRPREKRSSRSCLKLLTLVASVPPTVFWIEDIQWADHSTLEFCRRLNARGPIPGLIVIATARTGTDEHSGRRGCRSIRHQSGENRAREADIGGVEAADCEPRGHGARRRMAAAILESTGGIPLYIEEVVRSAVAGGHARAGRRSVRRVNRDSCESAADIRSDRRSAGQRPAHRPDGVAAGPRASRTADSRVIARILGLTEDDAMRGLGRLIDAEIIEPILTELSPGFVSVMI